MAVCTSSDLHWLAILARDGTFCCCEGTEIEWRHGLAVDRNFKCGVGLVRDTCTRRLRRCHVDLEGLVTELTKLAVALRNHEDTIFIEKQRSECRRFLLCTWEDGCCLEVHGLAAMLTLRLWREGTLVCDECNLNPVFVCLNGVAILDDEIVLE